MTVLVKAVKLQNLEDEMMTAEFSVFTMGVTQAAFVRVILSAYMPCAYLCYML